MTGHEPPPMWDDWAPSDDDDPRGAPTPTNGKSHIKFASDPAKEIPVVPGPDDRWPIHGVSEIFAPLEPINYLVEAFDICPGAPTLIAGYGFGGKTIIAQSLALSIASGTSVFDQYACKKGKVLHVDYEQGFRLTRARYQRLARGMGLEQGDLDGYLEVVPMPKFYMDDPRAEQFLLGKTEGCTLAIVDSFRAASPTLDENDSASRSILDIFTRVSEKTGCCFLPLHHAKKTQNNGRPSGPVMDIRGSGAFYDASASVFVLSSEPGKPKILKHLKARNSGVVNEPLTIQIFDVELDGDPRAGLGVKATEVAKDDDGARAGASSHGQYRKAIIEAFRKDREPKSKNGICALAKGTREKLLGSVEVMLSKGELTLTGKLYSLSESALVNEWSPGDDY